MAHRHDKKGTGRLKAHRVPAPNPQLFDDTSMQGGYGGYPPNQDGYKSGGYVSHGSADYSQPMGGLGYPQMGGASPYGPSGAAVPAAFSGQNLLNDPMANMAMQYGQTLAGQGTEYVHKNIEKYKHVATSKLKYYFAVDTAYVGKKLGLLIFPFAHKNWALQFSDDEPVAPRYDINAPDLYIPVMAFVTYILLAGLSLGTQNRFSPEQLGLTASSALVWTIIELILLMFTMYIVNVTTGLKYLDLLAYCGYKYVGIILVLLSSLAFSTTGYYVVLAWTSLSIAFFLVRSLKLAIVPHTDSRGAGSDMGARGGGYDMSGAGNKRRLYLLLLIAFTQPALIWWLTRHLARFD